MLLSSSSIALASAGYMLNKAVNLGNDDATSAVSFSDFAARAQTGDLILTSCPEITSLVRFFTPSPWSHSGIIIRKENGKLYEWSSHTASEQLRNSNGTVGVGGPQLVPIEEVAMTGGGLYWKRLRTPPQAQRSIIQCTNKLGYSCPFSSIIEFLAYLGLPWRRAFSGYGSGYACSHIVAITYAQAGLIDLNKHISLYVPNDFSDSGSVKWKVPISPLKMVIGCSHPLIKISQ